MHSLVSLFTGAGGLDLGLESAGFDVKLCVENDATCHETISKNRPTWKIAEPSDIFKLKPKDILKQADLRPRQLDLLAGGPPCQPFSKAGYWHKGDSLRLKDPRAKTLQAYLKVVETLLPKVILLENVEGISFSEKSEGLQLLLDGIEEINQAQGALYNPTLFAVNAAEYGVPQLRRRVFLIAARDGLVFELPKPTHGPGRVFHYVSAWEAIGDLENTSDINLSMKGKWADLLPSIPEGWNYLWHTSRGGGKPLFGFRRRYWSFLLKLAKDKPSWTIQAQPGPSVGPFHWKNRLLSIRELCRLQTFPDSYEIMGDRRSAQRQLGNAVPPLLGEIIGRAIIQQFFGGSMNILKYSFTTDRTSIPLPERLSDVPRQFTKLIGNHPPHPGEGKGPGALSRRLAVRKQRR